MSRRLQNFLWIFDLETEVQFLGVLGLIAKSLNVISALRLTPLLIQFVTSPIYFVTEKLGVPAEIVPEDWFKAQLSVTCFVIIMNFLVFGWILVDVLLIRATISRNRVHLIPGFIAYACLCVTNLIYGVISGFIAASFIFFFFNFYAVLIIFSLYEKYREEEAKEDRISIILPEFNTNVPNFSTI